MFLGHAKRLCTVANKLLKCTGCGKRFPRESMISQPSGKFHSQDCMIKWAMAKQEAQRARKLAKAKAEQRKQEKAARAKHRADKERIRSRDEWYQILQALVNQYVVHVRDNGKPCFTCGTTKPNIKYDAGHYRSRGACKELRFELTNIHKQCSVNCNQHGSGMRAEYRQAIIEKYGQDHLEWLDGPHPKLKEQFPHYLDIKAEIVRYRKILRDSGLRPAR